MSLCGCFKHIHTQVINKQKVLKDKHNQNLDDEEKFVIYNFWGPNKSLKQCTRSFFFLAELAFSQFFFALFKKFFIIFLLSEKTEK